MSSTNLYNLIDEANRLITQGLLTGSMVLENGRLVKLNDNQILRLISLVKSDKLTKSPVALASLVPHDFLLPNVDSFQIPDQQPVQQSEPHCTNDDKPLSNDQAKQIDFDALERQINRNTKL